MKILKEYECFDCEYFEQHYAFRNGKLVPVFCGKCKFCGEVHPHYLYTCEKFKLKK